MFWKQMKNLSNNLKKKTKKVAETKLLLTAEFLS